MTQENRIAQLEKDLRILKANKLKASLELSDFLILSEIEWNKERELAQLKAKESKNAL